MRTDTHFLIPKLLILCALLVHFSHTKAQGCFNINTTKSGIVLEPGTPAGWPADADTFFLPCTKKISDVRVVLDFYNNTEKYFEDTTSLVATLLHNGFTYILSYDKATNTFRIPTNQSGLDTGDYSLTISSMACSPYGTPCTNCMPTYTFKVVHLVVNVDVAIITDPNPPILSCFPGSSVTLSGSVPPTNKFTAQWYKLENGVFKIITGATNSVLEAGNAGVYKYTLNGPAGCSGAEIGTVNPPQFPNIQITPNPQVLNLCAQPITGVVLDNFGGNLGNIDLLWASAGNGVINTGANTVAPVISAPGTYILTVTRKDNGCATVDSVRVVGGIVPKVSVQVVKSPNTGQLDCLTKQIKLTAVASITPGQVPFSYEWSTGETGAAIVVDKGNTYTVTVTAVGPGCRSSEAVPIVEDKAIPYVDIVATRDTVCPGQNVTMSVSTLSLSASYKWDDNSGNNTRAVIPAFNGANIYSVTVTDLKNQCTNSDFISIERVAPPQVYCNDDNLVVHHGEPLNLDCDVQNGSFIWVAELTNVTGIPASGSGPIAGIVLSLRDERAPGLVRFFLYGKNGGCTSDRTEVQVQVLPNAENGIYVPELITPNGDGQNDTWKIQLPDGAGNPESYSLILYNRYGSQVYAGNLARQLDATEFPDGTYYYTIASPNAPVLRGAVTILRK